MSSFKAGMDIGSLSFQSEMVNSAKILGKGKMHEAPLDLAENSAKNSLFDFYKMSACISHELGIFLSHLQMRLVVAESCTGGLLGTCISQVSGASNWFEGGIVSYSNELKKRLLGVEQRVLEKFGAVSAPVVCQMASGVCTACKSHIGLSISGIAGPLGGSAEKPVGTVFIGLSVPKNFFAMQEKIKAKLVQKIRQNPYAPLENGMENNWQKSCQIMKHIYLKQESKTVSLGAFETKARHFLFEGERENIRQSATLMALSFLYEQFL